jgi:UDP-N-acetylglucosamine 2-epimerase
MEYLDFVATMRAATAVVTDSGAVQEEAPALGTPVVVVREATDRPAGTARLIGPDPAGLVRECRRLADAPARGEVPGTSEIGAGSGRATQRVVEALMSTFARPLGAPPWTRTHSRA